MPKYKINASPQELKKLYFTNKLSMKEIGKILGCTHSAIVYKFKKLAIKSQAHLGLTKPLKITKEQLEYFYYKKNLSWDKIAKIYHCSEGGIQKRFVKYQLQFRGNKNRSCKYKKKDFSGNLIEKAYLIGFRLGDLNVKKRVNVIQVRCSTTHKAQRKLIKDLFIQYTTPYITKAKRGTIEIVCLVNNSFEFLLPKEDVIPEWIQKNKEHFFSFFAGYSDAEGSFYIKKPGKKGKTISSSFQIQTQQKNIILSIWKNLEKYKIKCPYPLISRKAGAIQNNGVINNKDMWRIEIARKKSLWSLLNIFEPYLKHGEKVKKVKEIRKNIIYRNSIKYAHKINLTN